MDSFADLWNSSAPPNPTQRPATTRQKHDAFTLLSASNPTSRSITPTTTAARSSTPNPSTTGRDAFRDLLTGSLAVQNHTTAANMTIAERAAEVERIKLGKLQQQQQRQRQQQQQSTSSPESTAWAGLDSLERSNLSKISTPSDDDWDLGDLVSKPSTAAQARNDTHDDLLGDFSSSSQTSARPASHSDFDLVGSGDTDDTLLLLGGVSTAATTTTTAAAAADDDEDDILGVLAKPISSISNKKATDSSTPPSHISHRRPSNSNSSFNSSNPEFTNTNGHTNAHTPSSRRTTTSSPPPHILGQIVEMGFSVHQARVALAATDSGVDVTAALELLLSNGAAAGAGAGSGSGDSSSPSSSALGKMATRAKGGRYDDHDDEEDDDELQRLARRRPGGGGPETSASVGNNITTTTTANANTANANANNIQDQADKILSQASEFGMSVFSKASVFWKEGKERVQKVYAERAAAAGAGAEVGGRVTPVAPIGGGGGGGSGKQKQKPRWMMDGARSVADDDHDEVMMGGGDGFKEEEGDVVFSSSGRGRGGPPAQRQQQSQRDNNESKKPTSRNPGDLFSDDGSGGGGGNDMGVYVSPFRRGAKKASTPAATTATAAGPISRSTSTTSASAPAHQNHSRRRRPRPPLIPASPASISVSNTHKSTGTHHFKLGQFPSALESYTLGIDALPEGHLLRVPLYNNRALVGLKVGDLDGVVRDVGEVVGIVERVGGPSPSSLSMVGGEGEEEKGATTTGWGQVDLGEAFVKALMRRAEAWEGREKWEEAGKDWGVLCGLEWAGGKVRGDAARGVGRCRRMTMRGKDDHAGAGAGAGGSPTLLEEGSKPKPKPKPKPASSSRPPPGVQSSSQALKNLRAANHAAETEDQLRHELKDSVDARLLTWKGGKETNIRALLGSLDTVLSSTSAWPGLGTQKKIGMAELVTPGQVKVAYTRTIARLHPDKLNASNTTVEQRMIANGVFGALNEAWNAFKQ